MGFVIEKDKVQWKIAKIIEATAPWTKKTTKQTSKISNCKKVQMFVNRFSLLFETNLVRINWKTDVEDQTNVRMFYYFYCSYVFSFFQTVVWEQLLDMGHFLLSDYHFDIPCK